MNLPNFEIPIQKITTLNDVDLFIKREDLVHKEISGNKYWKLFFSINHYLEKFVSNPLIITFGGAFSNHIHATSAVGKKFQIPTIGIIRGDELENEWNKNPTLKKSSENGMQFRFVSREDYRDKTKLADNLKVEFPDALIIPEGGTNELAVKGVEYMLDKRTKEFDYLCTAVGTGGTVAGISKFAEQNQNVLGFTVVKDTSLKDRIFELSSKNNFELIDADEGGYGKISDENVAFINWFKDQFEVQLDPIYTAKMFRKLMELAKEGYFSKGSKVLAFHTGGLQGIEGANQFLKTKNRTQIKL